MQSKDFFSSRYFWSKVFIAQTNERTTVMLKRLSYPIRITMKINPENFPKILPHKKKYIYFFFFPWRDHIVSFPTHIWSSVSCFSEDWFYLWVATEKQFLSVLEARKEPAIVSFYLSILLKSWVNNNDQVKNSSITATLPCDFRELLSPQDHNQMLEEGKNANFKDYTLPLVMCYALFLTHLKIFSCV